MTPGFAAAGSMALVDDGVLSVGDPVERALAARAEGAPVLSPGSVEAMAQDHLTAAQRAPASLFLGPQGGWGYWLAAPGPVRDEPPVPWAFGSNGRTGTVWSSDPARGLTGIMPSTRAMTSPEPPPRFVDFWDAAYAALAD